MNLWVETHKDTEQQKTMYKILLWHQQIGAELKLSWLIRTLRFKCACLDHFLFVFLCLFVSLSHSHRLLALFCFNAHLSIKKCVRFDRFMMLFAFLRYFPFGSSFPCTIHWNNKAFSLPHHAMFNAHISKVLLIFNVFTLFYHSVPLQNLHLTIRLTVTITLFFFFSLPFCRFICTARTFDTGRLLKNNL